MRTTLTAGGQTVTLVAVAAILVASIRLHCLDYLLNRIIAAAMSSPATAAFRKGDELGWFQHGSTIIVFRAGWLSFLRQRPRRRDHTGRATADAAALS